MDFAVLQKLQSTEYDMLCDIHEYCVENNIEYFLYAGTALGAVKYGGFIPWDDDIDIAMTRDNYAKFYKTWHRNPMKGYYFENHLDNQHCPMCFGKIRKDGTVFIQIHDTDTKGHKGIWVDVFPFDKVSNDKRKRKKTIRKARQLILLTRANVKKYGDSVGKKIVRAMIGAVPYSIRLYLMQRLDDYFMNNDRETMTDYSWQSLSKIKLLNKKLPMSSIGEYTYIYFNDRQFMINKNYEVMLKAIYGDYSELPPANERVNKHHPVRLQFSDVDVGSSSL